jgi:serine/threonine protein kinase
MKTIQITGYKSSNLNPLYSSVSSIEIEDNPFDSGAFGEVYISRKINGRTLPVPQVVKVFIDDGSGSSVRGLRTIEQLQQQIINLNNELKSKQEKPIENVVALGALPQFSYTGTLNGKTILGYSANFLDSGKWLLFDKIFNDPNKHKKQEYKNRFYNLSLKSRLYMAHNLVEGFSYLEKMNFIYADLNPKNFFVNMQDKQLCLIDYEGGAIMDSRGNAPETFGKLGEWLAPEIQKQLLSNNTGHIKVNLNTDTWAVAIGIHFMLFPYHPLFYLKTRGEKEMEYFKKYQWPEINKSDSNYRNKYNTVYDKYIDKLRRQIPSDLVKVMSITINNGHNNPNTRVSYKQWLNVIQQYLATTPVVKQPVVVPRPVQTVKPVEQSTPHLTSQPQRFTSKYCDKCGKPYNDAIAVYCSGCGKKRTK